MIKVIGVRFKKAGKIYYFSPAEFDIKRGQYVIVETARGIEFGECVIGIKQISEDEIISPLKKVLRIATEEDIIQHKENKKKESIALEICLKKISEHNLEMKLIDVEYTFPTFLNLIPTTFTILFYTSKKPISITLITNE